jgi:phosphonate transport system substrate-binding protein
MSIVALGWISAAEVAVAKDKKPIVFGSVAMDTPAVMHKRLTPLTKYLSKELGRPVELKLSPNMADAIDEVARGNVDLAYLTPVAYIKSHDKGKTKLIAKTVTKGKASFQLMIVVKDDSPMKDVRDLVGKDFAFGDEAALLQRAVVVGANMPLAQLRSYHYLGHYDNIVRSVLFGDYHAGILKDTMAFKWEGKGVRTLYTSPHLPPYNIAARGGLDDKVYEKLKKAFLSLDKNNKRHFEVIKALDKKYDGFAPTSDAEYDVVRKLVKPFIK